MKNEVTDIQSYLLPVIPTADQALKQTLEASLRRGEEAKAICLTSLYLLFLDEIKRAINKGEFKARIYSYMSSDIQAKKHILNHHQKEELLSEFIRNIRNKGYIVNSPKSAKSFFETPDAFEKAFPIIVEWHTPEVSN